MLVLGAYSRGRETEGRERERGREGGSEGRREGGRRGRGGKGEVGEGRREGTTERRERESMHVRTCALRRPKR